MKRDPRLWFPLAFLAAVSLLTVAALLLPKPARPRPTEPAGVSGVFHYNPVTIADPPPNQPNVPPRLKVLYLEFSLQSSVWRVRLLPGASPGRCFALGTDADPATLDALPPTEEYADCWRGAVLCLADPSPGLPTGPHCCYAGDFWLFGDLELLAKVRPAAEMVHFGPYRETP